MIAAVTLFEFAKFYVFGDRFLAEGVVSYLITYQIGVIFERIASKRSKTIDLYIMPITTWLIVFLREPFFLVTFFLFLLFLLPYFKKRKILFKSASIFLLLSVATILFHSTTDYFFNVVTVNQNVFTQDVLNQPIFEKILKIIFYPVYFIISPEPWTVLRTYVAIISIVFLIEVITLVYRFKNWKLGITIIITLALTNLRPEEPNILFFEAFHISVWLMALIVSTIFIVTLLYKKMTPIGITLMAILVMGLLNLVFGKNYFIYDKISTHEEFFNNFSPVMDAGTTIRNLSNANDTLFVDGYDDLIIWEAKLQSPYKYTWYTSFMPNFSVYTNAREEMFLKNPPDFYYGQCLTDASGKLLKSYSYLSDYYRQLSKEVNRGCILIHKNKIPEISPEKWAKISSERYGLQD